MRVLFCGDAVVNTGFARCTHSACDALHAAGHDVAVVGINFWGDPHPYPYPIFTAANPLDQGNDVFGVGRLAVLTHRLHPDVVVLLTDPWNVKGYLHGMAQMPQDFAHPRVVGWLAVDAKNQRGHECNELDHVIAWTDFGAEELVRGGYTGETSVVPLGVDHRVFVPQDRAESRRRTLPSTTPEDAFVVGVVGRNQQRKRIDLTLQYFAEWIHSRGVEDAHLYLHVSPTGERGIDLASLALYHGLRGKVIVTSTPELGYGVNDGSLPLVYSACDVLLTTTQGEGWGLPVLEAMACGTPCIVPDWSGLGSWVGDAAVKVPCTDIAVTAPLNGFAYTIGGIANKAAMVEELDAMYRSQIHRETYRRRGLKLAQAFSWDRTGREFVAALERVMAVPEIDAVEGAMMRAVLEWNGAKELQGKLLKVAQEFPKKVAAALYHEAELIMTDSKENYVPVDLGTLRDSGGVAEPVIDEAGNITVQMYYGGAASAYALAVHEHPSPYSPFSWEGVEVQFKTGGPKYLELPFNQAAANMARNLAERLKL